MTPESYALSIRDDVTKLLHARRHNGPAARGTEYTLLLPTDAPPGLATICGLRVIYSFDVDQPAISDEPIPWQEPREPDCEPWAAADEVDVA